MPLLLEGGGLGEPPGEEQLEATSPIAPVGKGDDGFLPHPQHLAHHSCGVVEEGQGLAEDDEIETAVGVIGQPLLQIALAHAQPPPHTGQHPRLAQFNPPPLHLFVVGEIRQQFAIATPQIQHFGLGGNKFGHNL